MGDLTLVTTTDTAEQVRAALTADRSTPAVPAKVDDAAAVDTPVADAAAAKVDDPVDDKVDGEGDKPAVETETDARKSRYQARIDRLNWEKHQRDHEIETLRAENALLRAPKPGTVAAKPTFAEPKPKLDNFDSVELFTEALGEWTEKKVKFDIKHDLDADRARVESDQRTREVDTALASHTARIEAFRTTHADFDEVAQQAIDDQLPYSPMMAAHVQSSDLGPDILYHLAKNPDECRRIAALPNGPALVALGELQADIKRSKKGASPSPNGAKPTLVAGADTQRKQPKPPPPPVTPVGGASTVSTKDPDNMTHAEYKEYRNKGGGRR